MQLQILIQGIARAGVKLLECWIFRELLGQRGTSAMKISRLGCGERPNPPDGGAVQHIKP